MLEQGSRRVLITGAGSGIGAAVARQLLDAGARVTLVGRRLASLEAVASHAPDRATCLAVDLADPQARSGILDRARQSMGGLDGLVYSAGTVEHQLPGTITEGALRQQLEVNLVAPLQLMEAAITQLDEGGAVVLITSTLAQRPVPTSAVYSAAKAGLEAAMRAFVPVAAHRQVRLNAVSPGVVKTEMVPEERRPGLQALHPLGRLGEPSDIAEAVRYLLNASWVTGTTLIVDGGLLTRDS